ncbi:cinnamoyl-CoA reductase-like SNL6 isoform X2 [Cucurbita pepo subsp. pepo]|uniref:cinnamoyl-CoA reductase-like SNL6 isoform X2 n=1 Tax=Cucurbita pepo subsp. pepo TaxID=3664 RepID=UPI000C9D7591|nr:cinnamoyl-CoA reductase-like SNL6 isoform X2 [Cucurbita pepo subsp. pepo]
MDHRRPTLCVLDASSYVGLWVTKGLINRGYPVHAAVQKTGNPEIEKTIREMGKVENGLVVFPADIMDYQSILVALKGCSGLFCCMDTPHVYDEKMVDLEVRGTINVVEACARTDTVDKIVFTSSLTAAVWRENILSEKDVDERCWSDKEFCRKMKLWYPLAKTLSEQAAWALAMDRRLNMVSINAGLVLGPAVAEENSVSTISYLKVVDVKFLVDVHIRAMEDSSTGGRYFCFDQIVNSEDETIKLANTLRPLISIPPRYEGQGREGFAERLRSRRLHKLIEGAAS